MRLVGERTKVRRGEIWYNVVPQGDGLRFEQRGELTFLLGQYRLVRTEAPRLRQSVIEGEGDLPEEALRSPRAWLREAKTRRLVIQVRPFGLEQLSLEDGVAPEPTLVFQIGDCRGLLPTRLADLPGGDAGKAGAIMGGWLASGLPLAVMVQHLDADTGTAVFSRRDAREYLARHAVERGSRARMVVREVFPDRLVGDIGVGRDVWLYAGEWDGLPHQDLRRLAAPGDAFDVEVTATGEACVVSRARVVGDQWERRTASYHKYGVYRGRITGRTRSGDQWHVELGEGIDVVCSAPVWMSGSLEAGRHVNVRLVERRVEQRLMFGAIIPR